MRFKLVIFALMGLLCLPAYAKESILGRLEDFLTRTSQDLNSRLKSLDDVLYRIVSEGRVRNYSGNDHPYTMSMIYQSKQAAIYADPEFPRAIGFQADFTFSFPTHKEAGQQRVELIQANKMKGYNWASIVQDEAGLTIHQRPGVCMECHSATVPVQNKDGAIVMVQIFRPMMDDSGIWNGWYGSEANGHQEMDQSAEALRLAHLNAHLPARLEIFDSKFQQTGQWYRNLNLHSSLYNGHIEFMFLLLVSHPQFERYRAALSLALLTGDKEVPMTEAVAFLPAELQAKFQPRLKEIIEKSNKLFEKREQISRDALFPGEPQKYNVGRNITPERAKDRDYSRLAMLSLVAEALDFKYFDFMTDTSRGKIALTALNKDSEFLYALNKVFPETRRYITSAEYHDRENWVYYAPIHYNREQALSFAKAKLTVYKPITVESIWHAGACATALSPDKMKSSSR